MEGRYKDTLMMSIRSLCNQAGKPQLSICKDSWLHMIFNLGFEPKW